MKPTPPKEKIQSVAKEIAAEMTVKDTQMQMTFNTQNLKSVNFKMRPELHKTLKTVANRREVKLYELIDEICAEYIENHNIKD